MATYINLTTHVVNVRKLNGETLTVHPFGVEARVSMDLEVGFEVEGVEFKRPRSGELMFVGKDGYPSAVVKAEANTLFWKNKDVAELIWTGDTIIVSAMAKAKAALFFPNNTVVSPGPLLRNEQGQPVGCDGLLLPEEE